MNLHFLVKEHARSRLIEYKHARAVYLQCHFEYIYIDYHLLKMKYRKLLLLIERQVGKKLHVIALMYYIGRHILPQSIEN